MGRLELVRSLMLLLVMLPVLLLLKDEQWRHCKWDKFNKT